MSLLVFGKRVDGFHDLHTVMATLDWADDLSFRHSTEPGIHLHCSGLETPSGPENLVHRAADLLARHAGLKPALDIYLHKRLPSGAGLGGGSSDAASCLMGLNRFWQLGLIPDVLRTLAAQLGSDVPFFLYGPVAVCTGRGEVVTPLNHRPTQSVLLLLPEVHCATAKIYQAYRSQPALLARQREDVEQYLRQGDLNSLLNQGYNSLKETCLAEFAQLNHLVQQLESLGIGPVHLSGSGSCLYVTSPCEQQMASWQTQIQLNQIVTNQVVRFSD